MKRMMLCLAVSLLAASCGQNYSTGERVGVVTKISKKGLFWHSWEGEMLIALPVDVAGTTMPEKFQFNVAPETVSKIKDAANSGQRVRLIYRQWFIQPISIDNDHVVIDVQPVQEVSR